MSVFLEEIVERAGRTADETLVGHAGYALRAFAAGLARRYKQGVAPDPEPDEPAHAVVFGKKTKSISRALAKPDHSNIIPETQAAFTLPHESGMRSSRTGDADRATDVAT